MSYEDSWLLKLQPEVDALRSENERLRVQVTQLSTALAEVAAMHCVAVRARGVSCDPGLECFVCRSRMALASVGDAVSTKETE